MAVSCDPDQLIDKARCFHQCITGDNEQAVAIYLMCAWAGAYTPPEPGGIKTFTITLANPGYLLNEILTAGGAGDGNATLKILSLGAGGIVTGLVIVNQGTGYTAPFPGLSLNGGSGLGTEISIDSVT